MAARSVAVVGIAVVGCGAVAGGVPEVGPRKEAGFVVGDSSVAQRYSCCHYCDLY